jgi:hypothetical protein
MLAVVHIIPLPPSPPPQPTYTQVQGIEYGRPFQREGDRLENWHRTNFEIY